MIGQLTNHLWQSTLFALCAALLTLAYRWNRAKVRYSLWLMASLKFLIPFSVLIGLGSQLQMPTSQQIAVRGPSPDVLLTIDQFSEPFVSPAPSAPRNPRGSHTHWWLPAAVGIWLCGVGAILYLRCREWRRIRTAAERGSRLDIPLPVEARLCAGLLEPGVVGLWPPVLLLPEGIIERLTPAEFEAVIAHELHHVRRRDNLFASIHMLVEAIFWFHPLVWWIGARLVEERELACDEHVVSLGNQPDVYADAILNVCKLYTESPLACVSGVTGANIRRRIEAIMSNHRVMGLNLVKKSLLVFASMAAVLGPVSIGVLIGIGHAPRVLAQSAAPRPVEPPPVLAAQKQTVPAPKAAPQVPAAASVKFDVASVKLCGPGEASSGGRGGSAGRIATSPGRLMAACQTVDDLIREAYLRHPDGTASPVLLPGRQFLGISMRLLNAPIEGSPAWAHSDRYTVEAEADGTPSENFMRGPMLQDLLQQRFKLKIHADNRELPVYALTVAGGSPKLKTAQEGSCIAWGEHRPAPPPAREQRTAANMPCGLFVRSVSSEGLDVNGTTIANLCRNFSAVLDRDVVDKTGIEGLYDIHLDIYPEHPAADSANAGGAPVPPSPPDPARTLSDVKAALKKIGLNLEPAKGTGKFLVVDHVERPSEN